MRCVQVVSQAVSEKSAKKGSLGEMWRLTWKVDDTGRLDDSRDVKTSSERDVVDISTRLEPFFPLGSTIWR